MFIICVHSGVCMCPCWLAVMHIHWCHKYSGTPKDIGITCSCKNDIYANMRDHIKNFTYCIRTCVYVYIYYVLVRTCLLRRMDY